MTNRHHEMLRDEIREALAAAGVTVRVGKHPPAVGEVGVRGGTVEVFGETGRRTLVRLNIADRSWRPAVPSGPDFDGNGGYTGRGWRRRFAEDVARFVAPLVRR